MLRAALLASFVALAVSCVDVVAVRCAQDRDCEGAAQCVNGTCAAPPVDAGPPPVDAGPPPVDAGPLPVDAGPPPVDAGPPPVDAGPPVPWADPDFGLRARLSLSAPDENVVPGSRVRVALAGFPNEIVQTNALASGDDLRIFYFDGQTHTQLPRAVADGFDLDDDPLELMVPTPRSIPQGTTDSGYFAYWGNPQATPPPGGISTANVFVSETQNAPDVLGASYEATRSLEFEIGNPEESWLVVVCFRFRTDSGTSQLEYAGMSRLVVNGVPEMGPDQGLSARNLSQNERVAVLLRPFAGVSGPQVVTLEARGLDETAGLEHRQMRMVAFRLPTTNQPAAIDATLGEVLVSNAAPAAVASATVTPSQDAPYLLFAQALQRENDSGNGTDLNFQVDGVIQREARETQFDLPVPGLFQSALHLDVLPLAGGVATTAEAFSEGSDAPGALVRNRLVGLAPVGGLQVQRQHNPGPATPGQVLVTLTNDALTLPHRIVLLGVATVEDNDGDPSTLLTTEFRSDGAFVVRDELASNRASSPTQIGVVHTALSTGGEVYDIEVSGNDVGGLVEDGTLLLLRYPAVSTSQGATEARP